ncbi:MAG: alpha/beta fold hydrolase [Betaproteobacteria bacterium]|nr:alpha/beta fold hydrolase [Betaproteobacteria bacterium]
MPSVQANGIQIEYESFGDPAHPAVLLIMGLGLQMLGWKESLCRALADAGFHVIRFDNRDCGLSSHFDHAGAPNVLLQYLKFQLRMRLHPVYTLDDMAADAVGLMDALGVESAHVAGASMGGMIAQNLTARFPHRVRSLTSIMSTTGSRRLPNPEARTLKAILAKPPRPGDVEAAIRRLHALLSTIGSRSHPDDPALLRERCERHVRRAYRPAGMARQLVAIAAADDRSAIVRGITRPTLVVHGDEDPLLKPECGRETARLIPGARLEMLRGMGHDMPDALAEEIVGHLVQHFRLNS